MIQVINRAIDILEYVGANPTQPKLMGHIASELKLNTATCANIIKTLVNRRLLKKMEQEKGYILGEGLSEILTDAFGYRELIVLAFPEMEKAEKILNENNLIAVLKGDKRIVVQRKNTDQLIQATTLDEKNAYDSSTGRLLIAMMPDKDLHLYVKKYGLPQKNIWPDAANRIHFFDQVNMIRKNGYALIEDSVQIIGVATPIYRNGRVIASFSVYLPSFRFNNDVRNKMIEVAVLVSKTLSR